MTDWLTDWLTEQNHLLTGWSANYSLTDSQSWFRDVLSNCLIDWLLNELLTAWIKPPSALLLIDWLTEWPPVYISEQLYKKSCLVLLQCATGSQMKRTWRPLPGRWRRQGAWTKSDGRCSDSWRTPNLLRSKTATGQVWVDIYIVYRHTHTHTLFTHMHIHTDTHACTHTRMHSCTLTHTLTH